MEHIDTYEALSRLYTSAKENFWIFVKHYFHSLNVCFWPESAITEPNEKVKHITTHSSRSLRRRMSLNVKYQQVEELNMFRVLILVLFGLMSFTAIAESNMDTQPKDAILLTVFLKHDQSKNIGEIKSILNEQGFFENFPPEGVAVVSWYVMMGIGQVVTLEVPAHKLREVNLAIEASAWKAFSTEFYPTYNLYPVFKDKLKNKSKVAY